MVVLGGQCCDSCGLGAGGHDDQMFGADLSLVTVGRSFTVAKGFPPLWKTTQSIKACTFFFLHFPFKHIM